MVLSTIGVFKLSVAQAEVWTAQQLDPADPQFNCGGYVDIVGPFRPDLLERAISQVDNECEALHMRLRSGELVGHDEPVFVLAETPATLHTITVLDQDSPVDAALEWMKRDLAHPLALTGDSLFLHALFPVAQDRHLFYFRYHHLILDGFGQLLYWRRLARVYSALLNGETPPASPFGRLADLAAEEDGYRGSLEFEQDVEYWLTAMANRPERLAIATEPAGSAPGVLRTVTGSGLAMQSLHVAAAARQTHWSVIALAGTVAYLRRLSQHDDIVIGFPVRARTTRTSLTTPAMLSNELPLRLHVTPATPIDDLIAQVARQVSDLLAHQRYRGEDLHRRLRTTTGNGDLPTVVANIISFDGELDFGGSRGIVRQLSSGPVRELSIDFYGGADDAQLGLGLGATASRYDAARLAAHRARLGAFLRSALAAPGTTAIGEIELLTPAERAQLLIDFNVTERPYDLTTPLPALIAEQAARTPRAIAVQTAERSIDYAGLMERADRLAAHLVARGVRHGDVVGVHDIRSIEMVVSLLAVLRAGAAYLPLDPELPTARVRFQLRDAGVRVVLSRSTLIDQLVGSDAEVITVDTALEQLPAGSVPDPGLTPESAAYVIYTSGSTGQPKGVVVPHRGVVNRLIWMQQDYRFGPDDRVLQKTNFSFDVSVWEFFLPLITGARLHLLAPGAQRDPEQVARAIAEHGITVLHFVPSMLDLFLDEHSSHDLGGLRHVFCSGEALRPQTVTAFFERFPTDSSWHDVQLHNLYGPTEASVDVTAWRCLPGVDRQRVPIGRPVANTQIYVLDPSGRPVPVGVPGELHIGGVQVATGYLHRPELTEQRFVPSPFGSGTLYRTGDIACFRDDGVVEFLGRADHQVKVRGYRIEPGEIESALCTHPAVKQAVVLPYGEDGQRRLVGYIMPDDGRATDAVDVAELRQYLAERLPSYMVPAVLLVLEAFPMLPNGKLDRGALPEPADALAGARPATPPSTPEEVLLHQVWSTLLGRNDFGVDESFFAIGGDSMLAIRIRTALERQRGLTFTVAQLFEGPTIRELATVLRSLDSGAGKRTRPFQLVSAADRKRLPVDLDDAYPLSSMQAGMLYHVAYQEESSVYRVVTSVRVTAALDIASLRAACTSTAQRHPALRCSFDLTHYSEPLQLVHAKVDVPVELADDLGGLGDAERARVIEEFVAQAKLTRFEPASAPLFKFVVHPCGPDQFQLTVVEHHVVLDGWSDILLLEEVLDRYRAALAGEDLRLPEIASTYRDFVAAERAALAEPGAREFWTQTLHGAVPTRLFDRSALSADKAPTASRTRRFDVPIPAVLAQRLRALSRQEGLPLKAFLVAAHLLVLRTASGQDEVLTGLIANARLEEPGGDEVIGVFLNTLSLRIDLGGMSLVQLAHRVFEYEQRAAPHRRYPFGQIQRDLGEHTPLGGLDSYVNFMDFHRGRYRAKESPLRGGFGVADTNYPLAVDFMVEPEQGALLAWLDCDLAALPEQFCRRLAGYYRRALDAIAADHRQQATEVNLLSAQERNELATWNATEVGYDTAGTLYKLIEQQALRTPNATALAHQSDELTYADLDARANQLAHRLIEVGVRRGDLVGVSVRRGIDLVAALLGVLKAGAAYVPLDPTFPSVRLAMIAADAGLTYLVAGTGTSDCIPAPIVIDLAAAEDAAAIAALPRTPVDVSVSGSDLAYVMYTSGSTGTPKGAAVTHRNVVNFCLGMDQRVGCGSRDVVLAVTSVSFDISVLELLWPLMRGAKIVVASERIIHNLVQTSDTERRSVGFSLFFAATAQGGDGSRLILDAARFAETHGFRAIWTPERYFQEFGRTYPDPSMMSTVQTFREAGAAGGNVLTHLLGQSPDALAEKIAAYRQARQDAGHDGPGQVTAVVHTFMSGDPERARRDAESHLHALLEAVDRSVETSLLFGSPESCIGLVRALGEAGVDEIACLVDFGPATDAVLESLAWVDRLRRNHEDDVAQWSHSFAQLCQRHGVTLMQGTPSLLSVVVAEPAALGALGNARALLIGGEALPSGLARRLLSGLPDVRVLNMYGPTETTIWSTTYELDRTRDIDADIVPIGTPIANTRVRVVDEHGQDLPVGVAGELWIGGDGVAAGYLGRPDLTADRFVLDRAGIERFYRTGDRVRWRADGILEFLGRVDRQVKIHGHRVEPDEVESVLSRHSELESVAVVAVPGPNGIELVAYVAPIDTPGDPDAQQAHVRRWAEVWQETYQPDHQELTRSEFAGWTSSYTGEPIPQEQMREWLAHTVERISALQPVAVADVGVGVGLVLRNFAELTDQYHGIDISAAALTTAASCLGADRPLPKHVRLVQSGPEYLAALPESNLDTVILNSVVQYFPSTDYLLGVLTDAIRAVRPGGAVYIGDVRSVEMLPEFHASVQLHRAPVQHLVADLRTAVSRQVRDEPELCLSPAFFRRLVADLDRVGEVRVELKRGRADNELSLFRYDVTILVHEQPPAPPTTRVDWATLTNGIDDLLASISDPVLVVGVPNRRLVRPVAAMRTLRSMPDESTVWDLDRELWGIDETMAVHPEDLLEVAERAGRSVRLLVPSDGRFDVFDALLERREEAR